MIYEPSRESAPRQIDTRDRMRGAITDFRAALLQMPPAQQQTVGHDRHAAGRHRRGRRDAG